MNSLIVQIMLVFLAIGAAYGIGAGTITSTVDGINAVTKTFTNLSGLVFLLFVISQFLAYFTYRNMATIAAVKMGDALEHARNAFGLGGLRLKYPIEVCRDGKVLTSFRNRGRRKAGRTNGDDGRPS